MSDSKKLPVIEVGDTVIFRTDLEPNKPYGRLSFKIGMSHVLGKEKKVTKISEANNFSCDDEWWYSPEMVAQVIKPTKERVYTEQEMRTAIELARDFKRLEYPFPDYEYGYTPDKIIESLNK